MPRNVPPENFLFVPETRKERKRGPSTCILCPLIVFLLAGGLLAGCGYFLHEQSVQVLEWPDSSGVYFESLTSLIQIFFRKLKRIIEWKSD